MHSLMAPLYILPYDLMPSINMACGIGKKSIPGLGCSYSAKAGYIGCAKMDKSKQRGERWRKKAMCGMR